MEAEMVPSLSPLLQGADEWSEVLLLLPLLVALEAVLSADNAIALAAISRRLHDPLRQRQALNLGLLMALVLRMALIVAARWVLDAWPLQLAAAAYLLWLCGRHLLGLDEDQEEEEEEGSGDGNGPVDVLPSSTAIASAAPVGLATVSSGSPDLQAGQHAAHGSHHGPGAHHGHAGPTLASIALTLALTDLAFSLDSVAAAVAVTDRLALVMTGGLLGVLALRLTAGLFVRWLEVFSRLETAGYLAVGLVGIRLLLRLLMPDLEVPEWVLLLLVAALFLWGFSRRNVLTEAGEPETPEAGGERPGGIPAARAVATAAVVAGSGDVVGPAVAPTEGPVVAVPTPSVQAPLATDPQQP
jgi:YkoY family integral membrane protein